jgi:NADPH:quinone reductase-like Zn-dependent oxidoreductase
MPRAPFGSMAEQTVAPSALCVPLPAGLDDVTAAAIANPGMSSWAAYEQRAKLAPGETVLVNGATGAAGRLAVQIARYRGARRIIATGRDPEALRDVAALGADVTIPLGADGLEERFKAQFAEGVDVVMDYLWGTSAEHLMRAAARAGGARPIRYVQIGSAGGADITLPSAVLRAVPLALMGSGLGSVGLDDIAAALGAFFAAAATAGFAIATETVPLAEVAGVWARSGAPRVVLAPGA